MSVASFGLAASGAVLLLLSAIGLFRLPDALTRQHAATKSATLALGMILIGAAMHSGDPAFYWRVGVILVVLLVALPVASHMLARAAARHAYTPDELRDAPRIPLDGRSAEVEARDPETEPTDAP